MFRKIKNFILKTLTVIAGLVFMVSVSALDSDTYIPAVAVFISMGWLCLIGLANRQYLEDEEDF